MVQFYPLFQSHYHQITITKIKKENQPQTKDKIKIQRIHLCKNEYLLNMWEAPDTSKKHTVLHLNLLVFHNFQLYYPSQ